MIFFEIPYYIILHSAAFFGFKRCVRRGNRSSSIVPGRTCYIELLCRRESGKPTLVVAVTICWFSTKARQTSYAKIPGQRARFKELYSGLAGMLIKMAAQDYLIRQAITFRYRKLMRPASSDRPTRRELVDSRVAGGKFAQSCN